MKYIANALEQSTAPQFDRAGLESGIFGLVHAESALMRHALESDVEFGSSAGYQSPDGLQ
ncbi:MAG: hypothetical protein JXR40_11555 [Pontiellaceae bacterium]|nr:hypothetical protein [Pontiellaceae bacterium]